LVQVEKGGLFLFAKIAPVLQACSDRSKDPNLPDLGHDLKDDTAADAAIGAAFVGGAVESAIAVDRKRAQGILAVVTASEVVQIGIDPTIAGRGEPENHALTYSVQLLPTSNSPSDVRFRFHPKREQTPALAPPSH
jgi:hypothetical protein